MQMTKYFNPTDTHKLILTKKTCQYLDIKIKAYFNNKAYQHLTDIYIQERVEDTRDTGEHQFHILKDGRKTLRVTRL